ncbi:sigma-70 family RNA polymerase sigma factor [Salinicoccus cyprini]|uniref:Sigma-70 family RNA polymerase sigma factor n=1 Tax=Salinicoccus cyprini TaxID=2493691 RepID=A0A558AXK6_9STAP|nr:sigma-70 family RNA polymerase sigma factor [Salinicoccus cyprini]TVT28997.1 sigma-70 family RNA polymerase sigma factor [Salinicoccus cyprini]
MTRIEAELYERIQSGDRNALESLYIRYEKLLFSYAYKMTSNREMSEEIVQDVFIKVWRKKGAYDPSKGKLSTWLITLTRNSTIDVLRRQKMETYEYDERDDIDPTQSEQNSPVEAAVEAGEDKAMIRRAMEGLSREQQRIITLFYFRACSHSQIAESLDLPIGTVKSRIRLALQHLKKNIETVKKGGTTDES